MKKCLVWLLAAALLTVLLVVAGNFTIWEFQVSGNETVPDEAVLRALEDYGITIGTRSLDIDQKDMRNHVLLELEDVVWLAVNVRGCVARVQVVERVRGQDMAEDGPANAVARRPGLVTRVEALGGQAAVVPGDSRSPPARAPWPPGGCGGRTAWAGCGPGPGTS